MPENEVKTIGNYRSAETGVYQVMQRLISTYSEVNDLDGRQIKIIFYTKEMMSKGHRILGKVAVFSDRDRMIHDYDGLIILDYNFWRCHPDLRDPILFHQLCHFYVNEAGKLAIQAPEIREFFAVAKHFGAWYHGLKHFDQQLALFEGGGDNVVAMRPKSDDDNLSESVGGE